MSSRSSSASILNSANMSSSSTVGAAGMAAAAGMAVGASAGRRGGLPRAILRLKCKQPPQPPPPATPNMPALLQGHTSTAQAGARGSGWWCQAQHCAWFACERTGSATAACQALHAVVQANSRRGAAQGSGLGRLALVCGRALGALGCLPHEGGTVVAIVWCTGEHASAAAVCTRGESWSVSSRPSRARVGRGAATHAAVQKLHMCSPAVSPSPPKKPIVKLCVGRCSCVITQQQQDRDCRGGGDPLTNRLPGWPRCSGCVELMRWPVSVSCCGDEVEACTSASRV